MLNSKKNEHWILKSIKLPKKDTYVKHFFDDYKNFIQTKVVDNNKNWFSFRVKNIYNHVCYSMILGEIFTFGTKQRFNVFNDISYSFYVGFKERVKCVVHKLRDIILTYSIMLSCFVEFTNHLPFQYETWAWFFLKSIEVSIVFCNK